MQKDDRERNPKRLQTEGEKAANEPSASSESVKKITTSTQTLNASLNALNETNKTWLGGLQRAEKLLKSACVEVGQKSANEQAMTNYVVVVKDNSTFHRTSNGRS